MDPYIEYLLTHAPKITHFALNNCDHATHLNELVDVFVKYGKTITSLDLTSSCHREIRSEDQIIRILDANPQITMIVVDDKKQQKAVKAYAKANNRQPKLRVVKCRQNDEF